MTNHDIEVEGVIRLLADLQGHNDHHLDDIPACILKETFILQSTSGKLCNAWHGLRKNCSCETPLISTINKIASLLNQGVQVDVL